MFRAMVEAAVKMGDEVDTKVGLIREEFLQENEEKSQDEEVHTSSLHLLQLKWNVDKVVGIPNCGVLQLMDSKKDIEMLAIEADPFIPSECGASAVKKSKVKTIKKRVFRAKSNLKARGKKVRTLARAGNESKSRGEGEGERRVSSRLQNLAQTQREFEAATSGVSDELKIKEEKDDEDGRGAGDVEVPQQTTAKKRK